MAIEKLPADRQWHGADPEFDFKWRDRSYVPTRVPPICLLEKKEQLTERADSGWMVSNAYRDAIEISVGRIRGTGLPTLVALFLLFGFGLFSYLGYYTGPHLKLYFLVICVAGLANLYGAIYAFVFEFTPRPYTLLNRANRTVSFQLITRPNPAFPWKRVHRPFVTYSWDAAKARIYKENQVIGGQLARTDFSLWLVWGDKPDFPRTYKVCTRLGDTGAFEVAQMRLWEHVRRFMEEGGPHFTKGKGALGGVTRSRFTPPFPADILEAAGPQLSPAEMLASAR